MRRGRADPFCVVFVRGTAVDGVLLLDKMVIDRLNEAAIKLTTGSPTIQKKNCTCHLCSGAMLFQKKNLCTAHWERTRQSCVPPDATAIQV